MIKTILWERKDCERHNCMAQDIFCTVSDDSFIEITNLFVPKEDRQKGLGSALVLSAVTGRNDKIIVVLAGLSTHEYPGAEHDAEETRHVFTYLDKFYSSIGFVSINEMIGGYEIAEVYLYVGNDRGKELLKQLIEGARNGIDFPNCRRFLEVLPNYSSVLDSIGIAI